MFENVLFKYLYVHKLSYGIRMYQHLTVVLIMSFFSFANLQKKSDLLVAWKWYFIQTPKQKNENVHYICSKLKWFVMLKYLQFEF